MPKIISESKFREWEGLDRIQTTVHAMKCVYRELTKDDFGIDGEIEVVIPLPDGKGYQVSGGVIKFQSKSGKKYVVQDGPGSFASPVSVDDLELWHKSNYPTLYIVYHPVDDKLYWKEVHSYVKNTPNVFQPPLRITFDKARDEFTVDSYRALSGIADVSPPRISMRHQELLYANLLEVTTLPKMWRAPTRIKDDRPIRNKFEGPIPPFVIVDGYLYTFADLADPSCALRRSCYKSKAKRFYKYEEWWTDDVLRTKYIYLLNQLLGIQLYRAGVRYARHFKRNYFPRERKDGPLEYKKKWYNVRTKKKVQSRIAAKYYKYGHDEFWRHTAANVTFRLIGSRWYLQIIPKYYFTANGQLPYDRDKTGPYTTQIKAEEKNPHVLNHVLFWADVLSWGVWGSKSRDTIRILLDKRIVMTIDKMPVSGVAKFSIPYDPAIYEEPESLQLGFDWFSRPGASDDDEKVIEDEEEPVDGEGDPGEY